MSTDIIHFHHRRTELLYSSPKNRGEGEREGLPGLLARRRRGATPLLAIGHRRSAVRGGETGSLVGAHRRTAMATTLLRRRLPYFFPSPLPAKARRQKCATVASFFVQLAREMRETWVTSHDYRTRVERCRTVA
nr:hypothetical protein Itr_chr11CG16290 [Ipomoea trifida]